MRLYYITTKDKNDIYFWEEDIERKDGTLTCLAFFYRKIDALRYQRLLQEEDINAEYYIRSVNIKNK